MATDLNICKIVLCALFVMTTSAATAADAQQPDTVLYNVQNWRPDVVAIKVTTNNSTGCAQVRSANGNPQNNDTIPFQVGITQSVVAMSQRDCSNGHGIAGLYASASVSKPGIIIIRGNQLQILPNR
ncbi:hypothetical protein [Xanthomonas albilineans]|uniref:hypothetical protein n=1 Tax=Xanthomonas albilineans TaxID=29447 RepID=UPI000AA06219|nr:hypothetical protein [Xanthomonas albilineans]